MQWHITLKKYAWHEARYQSRSIVVSLGFLSVGAAHEVMRRALYL